METWYRTGAWRTPIEAVEVERHTEAFVWAKGGYSGKVEKTKKISEYYQHLPTWDAAHAYLLERAERRVAGLRDQLEAAKSHAGNIRGLKKPEGAA